MLTQLQRESKIHFPHTGWRTLCEEIPWSLLQPSVCFHYHLIIVQHKHDSKWSYTYWVVLTSSGFRGKPPQRLSQDYTSTACLQASCIAWTPPGMRFWPHRSNSRQKCISIYKHCASFCHKLCQKNNLKGKTPFNFNVFALGIQLLVSYWWSTCLRKGVTKHLLNFEIAVWQELTRQTSFSPALNLVSVGFTKFNRIKSQFSNLNGKFPFISIRASYLLKTASSPWKLVPRIIFLNKCLLFLISISFLRIQFVISDSNTLRPDIYNCKLL